MKTGVLKVHKKSDFSLFLKRHNKVATAGVKIAIANNLDENIIPQELIEYMCGNANIDYWNLIIFTDNDKSVSKLFYFQNNIHFASVTTHSNMLSSLKGGNFEEPNQDLLEELTLIRNMKYAGQISFIVTVDFYLKSQMNIFLADNPPCHVEQTVGNLIKTIRLELQGAQQDLEIIINGEIFNEGSDFMERDIKFK